MPLHRQTREDDGRWSPAPLRTRAEILRAIAAGLDKENTPDSHNEAKRLRKRAREIEGRDSWKQRMRAALRREKETGSNAEDQASQH